MLMVIMTAYAIEAYSAPDSVAAFCASVFIIGTLFARFTTSPLMAKFGRKRVLLIGAVFMTAFTSIYLSSMPMPALIATRFFHGMAYGMCSTAVATIVTSIIPKARKGEGVGYYMLSVTLGSAIGPFIGVFISRNVGYSALFIVALSVAVVAIPCILALKVPDPAISKKRTKQSEKVSGKPADAEAEKRELEQVEAAEDLIAGEIASSEYEREREDIQASVLEDASVHAGLDHNKGSVDGNGQTPDKKSTKPRGGFFASFLEPQVLPIACISGIIFFGYSSLLTFLTPYSVEIGLSRAASVFFVVYAIIIFLTRPLTGRLFDRKGPRIVMIPAFFSFMVGMVLIALAQNDWMVLISALFAGFGVGTVQSSGLAMAVRVTPDDRLSQGNSTYYMLVDLGVGVGPVLLGMITPTIGFSMMYLCMAVVGFVAFLLFMIICRADKWMRASV